MHVQSCLVDIIQAYGDRLRRAGRGISAI